MKTKKKHKWSYKEGINYNEGKCENKNIKKKEGQNNFKGNSE